jgi:hypothetical protein
MANLDPQDIDVGDVDRRILNGCKRAYNHLNERDDALHGAMASRQLLLDPILNHSRSMY